jgi:glycosyltransferase involved in cell wall biosynthesis
MKPLADIINEVQSGQSVDPGDLLPHLSVEHAADRFAVNAALARAYLKAGAVGRAKVFADRALLQSDYAHHFLPLFVEIQHAAGDVKSVRAAYKRIGMKYSAEGNIAGAIEYFNLSHYALQKAGRGDVYEYDFDVMEKVFAMARPYRFGQSVASTIARAGDKIRVAYLVLGASHSESVLVKLLCEFGRHHDRAQFDVRFYVPDRLHEPTSPEAIQYNLLRSTNIEKLESQGARVIAPTSTDVLECLLYTAEEIRGFRPHLLVTTAVLADFGHYFIRALRPAAVTLGLCYGPPEQYSPPDLDWVISATMHPLIDNPCSGSLIPIETTPPDPTDASGYNRTDFGIPEHAVVVLCAGRPEKLQHEEFWSALFRVLRENLDAFLLVIGMAEEPPFLAAMTPPDIKARFSGLGWRTDFLKILGMADILVDTFPSGGGITLFDAMALGKPVVTFHNDYSKRYSQAEWSVGDEWVEDPELLVARGDFDRFIAIVSRLIANPELRARTGARCRSAVLRSRGDPERMVRRHEKAYRKVIECGATEDGNRFGISWLRALRGWLGRRCLLHGIRR